MEDKPQKQKIVVTGKAKYDKTQLHKPVGAPSARPKRDDNMTKPQNNWTKTSGNSSRHTDNNPWDATQKEAKKSFGSSRSRGARGGGSGSRGARGGGSFRGGSSRGGSSSGGFRGSLRGGSRGGAGRGGRGGANGGSDESDKKRKRSDSDVGMHYLSLFLRFFVFTVFVHSEIQNSTF